MEERKRLSIEIDPEQKKRLEKFFKWGDLSPFFRYLIDDLLEMMEDPKKAQFVITAYVTRRIGLGDITKLVPPEEESEDN